MTTIPHLIEDDVVRLEATLRDLLAKSSAAAAVITDRAGFVIALQGKHQGLDTTTLGALSANTFAASAAIAGMIGEPNFSSLYQEGSRFSLLINSLTDAALLVIIFDAKTNGGAVKYFAGIASKVLAAHLHTAVERAPGAGLDFATLNVADPSEIFRRKPVA
jgi:predicted regulator of Ras-like GTPase activity (Roadblock/LC7/MglB family)